MKKDLRHRRFLGISTVELLIVMVIVAILGAYALPNFSTMFRNNRVANEANTLLSLLIFARSEALKRGQNVTVCPSTDGIACALAGSGWGNYHRGVIVFVDSNFVVGSTAGKRQYGGSATDPLENELIIRKDTPLSRNAQIWGNTTIAPSITYRPSGDVIANGSFYISVGNKTNDCQRRVVISNMGRPRIEAGRLSAFPPTADNQFAADANCGDRG
jgi:type IV fimbrial biogenesis protein FimT